MGGPLHDDVFFPQEDAGKSDMNGIDGVVDYDVENAVLFGW